MDYLAEGEGDLTEAVHDAHVGLAVQGAVGEALEELVALGLLVQEDRGVVGEQCLEHGVVLRVLEGGERPVEQVEVAVVALRDRLDRVRVRLQVLLLDEALRGGRVVQHDAQPHVRLELVQDVRVLLGMDTF